MKTHCCFCGQQCGIQLKVRDNQVIGFEPWEEFPFNHGMLCPKGVKRYLQGGHPDRLLDPLMRTADGFRQATWDEALDFTARRLREIAGEVRQGFRRGLRRRIADHGEERTCSASSRAWRSARGTSTTTAASAWSPPAPRTSARSASTARPIRGPTSPKAEVLLVIGANVGECAPITTDYIWRARDNGAQADRRRSAHRRRSRAMPICILPVRPGTDLALLMGMLHVIIRDGLTDRDFIAAHTTGFEKPRHRCEAWNPAARRRGDAASPPEAIEKAAHCDRRVAPRHAHCTRADSSTSPRASRTAGGDQHRAGHRQHRPRRRRSAS